MDQEEQGESYLVRHGPCRLNDCGSSDAAAEYSNGWIHCFSCGRNYPTEGKSVGPVQRRDKITDKPFVDGEVKAIPARGISYDVAKKYRYQIGKVPEDYPAKPGSTLYAFRGKKVHIENYYDEHGVRVGQKLRDKDKNFAVIGSISKHLFGRHCCPAGSKLLVITEGAIDALSYSEIRKNWPAVSIPNGADSAKAVISANLEYLESFDKVVLAFDNDKAGQEAVESCKGVMSPGKMFIAHIGEYKDFNEALDAGDAKAVINAIYNAEQIRPDGLVTIEDIFEEASRPIEWGIPWFLSDLTHMTYGRRFGEVYALGGGTGTGKTDVFTEQVAFDIFNLNMKVGILFLEQKPVESAKRLAGKVANRRFHIPDDGWTVEELQDAMEKMKGKITFYDSFGQTEWDGVKSRIRHMAISEGIRIFYVDHLTAMADTSDEKGSLEQIMKEMAGIADELNLIIHFISHLTTADGTPHEEGGRVAIRHFKGSRSIGFWSYFMFGLERDQQAEDEEERHTTTFRILKDRYTGQATGNTIMLGYDADHGRIYAKTGQDAEYGDSREEGF